MSQSWKIAMVLEKWNVSALLTTVSEEGKKKEKAMATSVTDCWINSAPGMQAEWSPGESTRMEIIIWKQNMTLELWQLSPLAGVA